MKWACMRLVFLLILTGISLPSSASAEFITVDRLLQELRSEDWLAVDRILNEIKKQGSQGNVIFVLQDIWNKDKEKYPDINWQLMETEYMQLNVVDVLVQASRNGPVEIDVEPLHEFALESVDSSSGRVVSLAVRILGYMGRDGDLEVILQVARRLDEGPFRAAVAQLSINCSERAPEALAELESELESEDRIKYLNILRETRSRLQDYRNDVRCRY